MLDPSPRPHALRPTQPPLKSPAPHCAPLRTAPCFHSALSEVLRTSLYPSSMSPLPPCAPVRSPLCPILHLPTVTFAIHTQSPPYCIMTLPQPYQDSPLPNSKNHIQTQWFLYTLRNPSSVTTVLPRGSFLLASPHLKYSLCQPAPPWRRTGLIFTLYPNALIPQFTSSP